MRDAEGGEPSSSPPSLTEPLLTAESGYDIALNCEAETNVAVNDAENPEDGLPVRPATARGDGGGQEGVGSGRRSSQSRNIPLTLSYTALAYAGRSLWSQSVLPAFVFLLRDGNPEYVGFVTAVMGVFTLFASLPSGAVADLHRRDAVLRAASVVGIVAIVATCVASYAERFDLLGGALAVWGLYWGMSDASLSALFADSMRDGDRSHYFTQRYILVKAGTLSGPAVALVMFVFLGNNWTVRDCAMVMVAGQGLSLPAVIMLCFFSDNYAVPHDREEGEESDLNSAGVSPRTSTSRSQSAVSSRSSIGATQATAVESSSSSSDSDSVRGDIDTADDVRANAVEGEVSDRNEHPALFCLCVPRDRKIPFLVAMADFTAGLAAGMSIRYFPIFFIDNLKLSPVSVQILYAISPLGQAFLSKMAQLTSKRLGRPQTTVLFKWIGISLMVAMIVGYTCRLPVAIVCAIFIVRDSFMNSTLALNKSLLMDTVPREERGKWSALESVNMFSWSGSAAVGGVLVMKMGLIFNFYVTAFLQFLATLPLIALFREVSLEAASAPSTNAHTSGMARHRLERSRVERRKGSELDEEMASSLLLEDGQSPGDQRLIED